MKEFFNIRRSILSVAVGLLIGMGFSCNSKSSDDEMEIAVTPSTVAVNKFSLKAKSEVAPALDSVFFSIDLDHAVIFNADSLPKGTNVSSLVPVISFAAKMSKAEIAVIGEQGDTIKKIDYLQTTTDSVDFSKRVVLNVSSADGLNSLEYRLKVNIHKQNPDSIGWERIDVSKLPSRLDNPVARKTVVKGDTPYSFVQEADNSFSICRATDIFKNEWTSTPLTLPFSPKLESLVASDDAFFTVDDNGALYTSQDGISWTELASGWQSVIGIYGADTVIGLKQSGDNLIHVSYSDGTEKEGGIIPGDFPISGRSAFKTISNKWAEVPTGFFVGGVCRDGSLSGATWGFDGNVWAKLNESLPEMEGTSIVKYTMFRKAPSAVNSSKDFDAWLIIGGLLSDNSLNRNVYMSFDNGVTWQRTGDTMSLPATFPAVAGADAFTLDKRLEADLADGWTNVRSAGTRADYEIIGTDIFWDCPYIFISGGYAPDGTLSQDIWRGVLMRLNFTPLI
ncbi:MAG: hypothetical protein K2K64_03070 [Muribaculaceae bacterium]|nr:hypothetical protein [Muribaculaceae bacterium]